MLNFVNKNKKALILFGGLFLIATGIAIYVFMHLYAERAMPTPVLTPPVAEERQEELINLPCGERPDMAFEVCCIYDGGLAKEDCTDRDEFERGQIVRFTFRPVQLPIPSGSYNLCITTDLVSRDPVSIQRGDLCRLVDADTRPFMIQTGDMLTPNEQGDFDIFVLSIAPTDGSVGTSTLFRASARTR